MKDKKKFKTFTVIEAINRRNNYVSLVSEYEASIKLVMYVLTGVGAFPVYKNKEGHWLFCVRSWTFLYCSFMYVTLLTASVISYLKYVKYYLSYGYLTFYDYLDITWCLIQKIPILIMPLIMWTESRYIPVYMHKWRTLQISYDNMHMKISLPNLPRLSMIWLCIILLVEISKEVMQYVIVHWASTFGFIAFLHYATYFTPSILNQVLVLFWWISCKALSSAGKSLIINLKQELLISSSTSPNMVRRYHSAWLDLCTLCRHKGKIFCYTYSFCFLYNFTLETTAVYFCISEIRSPSGWGTMLFMEMMVFALLIIFICSSAHQVKVAVGNDFLELLTKADVKTNINRQEVKEFLMTVRSFPPEISLGGFFTVNRQLLVSIGSTMVTYLVIIVQFDVLGKQVPSSNCTTAS